MASPAATYEVSGQSEKRKLDDKVGNGLPSGDDDHDDDDGDELVYTPVESPTSAAYYLSERSSTYSPTTSNEFCRTQMGHTSYHSWQSATEGSAAGSAGRSRVRQHGENGWEGQWPLQQPPMKFLVKARSESSTTRWVMVCHLVMMIMMMMMVMSLSTRLLNRRHLLLIIYQNVHLHIHPPPQMNSAALRWDILLIILGSRPLKAVLRALLVALEFDSTERMDGRVQVQGQVVHPLCRVLKWIPLIVAKILSSFQSMILYKSTTPDTITTSRTNHDRRPEIIEVLIIKETA
ncbi:unnamed protein product [Nippostrongylus brasiliensis]|uniref:Uncharacterized protein n=1 Tax=Nippostrongylus brasiliensis TaxID=27835 RepID=A0A0N4YZL9_NIPBR|nr:unnamed protein product [Nippostrongylus brasiliensis]